MYESIVGTLIFFFSHSPFTITARNDRRTLMCDWEWAYVCTAYSREGKKRKKQQQNCMNVKVHVGDKKEPSSLNILHSYFYLVLLAFLEREDSTEVIDSIQRYSFNILKEGRLSKQLIFHAWIYLCTCMRHRQLRAELLDDKNSWFLSSSIHWECGQWRPERISQICLYEKNSAAGREIYGSVCAGLWREMSHWEKNFFLFCIIGCRASTDSFENHSNVFQRQPALIM